MLFSLVLVVIVVIANGFIFKFGTRLKVWPIHLAKSSPMYDEPPALYPANSMSMGSFFDQFNNKTMELDCVMVHYARINGIVYGIGLPLNTPVAFTYFEKGELQQVLPDHPHFDNILERASHQLGVRSLELQNTALVLTVQGEFEEESMNDVFPIALPPKVEEMPSDALSARQLYGKEYQDLMFSSELDGPVDDQADESDFEEEESGADSSEETAQSEEKHSSQQSGYSVQETETDPELTEEEQRDLRLKHLVAERVMAQSVDLRLMASFYCKGKVYHVAQLLEPIIVIGRQLKGDNFCILDDNEADQVRPIIDQLVIQRSTRAPVAGVHTKSVPKYSSTSAADLESPLLPSYSSPVTRYEHSTSNENTQKRRKKKALSPFQEAQRNWYAQKAATNKRRPPPTGQDNDPRDRYKGASSQERGGRDHRGRQDEGQEGGWPDKRSGHSTGDPYQFDDGDDW